MAVIQLIIALVILGIIYRRMIKREVPEQISGLQGIIPVGFGFTLLEEFFYGSGGLSTMIVRLICIAATVVLFIIQIRVIVQFKKNAEKYCSMTFA